MATFTATSGQTFETTASSVATATATGSNDNSIPIVMPAQTSGSYGVNVYSATSSTQEGITGAAWSSGAATLTVASTSALSMGTVIGITGIAPSGYNGVFTITSLTSTTITYALSSNPGTYSSGGTISWFTKCGNYVYSTGAWTAGTCTATPSGGTVTITAPISSSPAASPPNTNSTGTIGTQSYFYPSIDFSGAMGVSGSAPGQDFGVLQAALTTNGIATVYTSGSNTTQNDLMCFSASETVSQCAASSTLSNFAGVSLVSGNSTTLAQYSGVATIALASSAMTTYDDAACTNATAGTVVDAGAATCSSGTQVGIIAQTNGTPVTSVPVYLKPASGASTTGYVLNPNGSGQTHLANVANVVRVGTFYLPVSITFSNLSILVGTDDTTLSDYYSWGVYSTSGAALCTVAATNLSSLGLAQKPCQQSTPVTLPPGTYVFMTTGNAAVAKMDTGYTDTISLLSSNTAGTSSGGAAPSSLSLTSGIIDDSGAVGTAVIGMN